MVEENRNSQFIGSFKYGRHPSSMGQNNGVFVVGGGLRTNKHIVFMWRRRLTRTAIDRKVGGSSPPRDFCT